CAVDRPVLADDVVAEALDDAVEAGRSRRIDLVRDTVGIDHMRAAFREKLGHGGLARTDPTGEPDDDCHRKIVAVRSERPTARARGARSASLERQERAALR